jgi:hypothetical protein
MTITLNMRFGQHFIDKTEGCFSFINPHGILAIPPFRACVGFKCFDKNLHYQHMEI